MTEKNPEPKRLRDGKVFHKKVQADWVADAEGDVHVEKTVKKDDKVGRLDVCGSEEVVSVQLSVLCLRNSLFFLRN